MPITTEADRRKTESDRYRERCFEELPLDLTQYSALPGSWDLSEEMVQDIQLIIPDRASTRGRFEGQFAGFTSKENLGQKREYFLGGICRYIGKLLNFCLDAERQGFDEAFQGLLTLHRVIANPRHVKVPAKESSRWLYMELYESFLSISARTAMAQSMLELLHSTRSYNIDFQRKFFSSDEARKFYYFIIQFFDGSGLEGEGTLLKQTLRVKPEPHLLKQQMLYGYLSSLGLIPFDGFYFATTFMLTKFTL